MATSRTATGKKTTSKIATPTPAKKPLAKKVIAETPAVKKPAVKIKAVAKKISVPKAPATGKSTPKPHASKSTVAPEERYKMIAAAAYLRAERRGFASGHALDDWVAAEAEIDVLLKA